MSHVENPLSKASIEMLFREIYPDSSDIIFAMLGSIATDALVLQSACTGEEPDMVELSLFALRLSNQARVCAELYRRRVMVPAGDRSEAGEEGGSR